MTRYLSIALALALCTPLATAAAGPTASLDPHDSSASFRLGLDLVSVEKRADATRVSVLDLMLFKLFKLQSREADEYLDLHVLDATLVEAFERRRDGDESSLRVLEIPCFSLFRRDHEGADHVDTRVIDLPLVGALFRTRLDGDRRRTSILFLLHVETSD